MEDVKKLEKQHRRISRYMGIGMYEKCSSELERPYLPPKGKEGAYKLNAKLYPWQKGVRGGNSTREDMDNKTILREGPLLHSSYSKEVRASECES